MGEFNNNENKEQNQSAREFSESAEYRSPQEFGVCKPNSDVKEDNAENGGARKQSKAKSKNRLGDALKAFCVAAVAVVTVSASTLFVKDVTAEIISLSATDTSISYTVNVGGDDALELVVKNDFTHRVEELTNGENTGEVGGLKPNMQYTVAVVYQSAAGERTVAEDVVRTEKYAVAEPLSAFYSIKHGCTCNVDGYFHFTLDFTDENGYWTDFAASLKDGYGNTSDCVFTDDLHAEQSIDVALKAGLKGTRAQFTLSFKTDGPGHVPDGDLFDFDEETLTLTYSAEVKI